MKNNGFTLVELLVVIFIVGLFSGIILAGYNQSRKNNAVNNATQLLAVNLQRAQNLALAGKAQGAIIPAGYGFYSQSAGQYLLFYNTGNNKQYNSGNSVVLETIVLSDGVSLSPSGQSVFFIPPDPTTYLNNANSGSVVFTLTKGSANKNVTIYANGRIDIE